MDTTKHIFALGFFDGVHLGHQVLLRECCRMAAELDAVPAAITFDKHPKSLVLSTPPVLLSTEADRRMLLERYGIRQIHTFPVVPEVMGQNWEIFVEKLLDLGAVGFVCGDDFRFGYRGQGNAASLQEFCRERELPCTVVPEQTLDGQRISSTWIRSRIEDGDLETAVRYLGHPHVITGQVTAQGPAVTLKLPEGVAVPKPGSYEGLAQLSGGDIPVRVHVGTGPEAELLLPECPGPLSGREITLQFVRFSGTETQGATL